MIGVLFNSGAGKSDKFDYIGKYLERNFHGEEILTGSSTFGLDYIKSAKEIELPQSIDFPSAAGLLIKAFGEQGIDRVISIGGDGTQSFVAFEMVKASLQVPLTGIAGGSANVGPLLSYSHDNLHDLNSAEETEIWHSCLEVVSAGQLLGCAFNDVVLADTFLGTKNGKICNYDAHTFYNENKFIIKNPSIDLMDYNIKIFKNSEPDLKLMENYKQIIVAPIANKSGYVGKAISGILCLAGFLETDYCLALSDDIVVDADLENKNCCSTTQHVLLKKSDSLTITGVNGNTYVMIDGNVHKASSGDIEIKYREEAISTLGAV